MKIAESAIQFVSSRTAVEYSERQETLTVWQQGKEPVRADQETPKGGQSETQALAEQATKVFLSVQALQQIPDQVKDEPTGEKDSALTNLNLLILQMLFEKLTGRKMKPTDFSAVVAQPAASAKIPPAVAPNQAAPTAKGWGVRYERHDTYRESESTKFSAQGVVLTADGQKIEIGVDLNMSRSFTSTLVESFRAGDALKDPLVINFDGTAAHLTQNKFSFDIDADGSKEQISFVAPGSGFLALDTNNDGAINNGAELFGASNGDGLAELAAYDGDKNGWIDENDAVYSRLRIWAKTATGENQLLALGDKGIGALFLGRVDTPFAIKDSSNALQGQVRSTGIFLREAGGAGTLQQLDLVV